MENNFKNEINKEFYKMQIESVANKLIARADDILQDWDKGIKEINIKFTIDPTSYPEISVEKKYIPWEVK